MQLNRKVELLHADTKEAGFVVYSWMKARGLANLGRCCLCRENINVLKESYGRYVCIHCQHSH